MNSAAMFSRATDEWATPRDLFADLNVEFNFGLDAAATYENKLTPRYLNDALGCDWLDESWWRPVWLNPPYSKCRQFIAKAAEEARKGCTVVCLVPARTDTLWWHLYVWDGCKHRPRPGVEVRFLKGRLKFGGSKNSAPFPSVVIIFRPVNKP